MHPKQQKDESKVTAHHVSYAFLLAYQKNKL